MADLKSMFASLSLYLAVLTLGSTAKLVVNVKTRAGDITKEAFESFPEKDLVSVSFKLNDGRYFDIAIDFKKNVQIFKVIALGEIDMAENSYEVACFAIKIGEGEYISSDAMSKLRQKNPDTIRSPEDDLGTEEIVLDHLVPVEPGVLSDPAHKLCDEVGFIFAKKEDINRILSDNYTSTSDFVSTKVQNLSGTIRTRKRCHDTKENKIPCICRLPVCLGWYPCDLKYCQGQDVEGQPTEYRCGIKTCGRCRDFDYLATEKRHCFWDDNPKS